MRICHAIFSSPWCRLAGGGQYSVHFIADAMTEAGHDVHVIYSGTREERKERTHRYTVHWAGQFFAGGKVIDFHTQAWVLRRLLHKLEFDVVVGHAENALLFHRICRTVRVPFDFIFHSSHLPGNAGGWNMLRDIDYYMLRSAVSGARRVFVFSEYARAVLLHAFGSDFNEKVHSSTPGLAPAWREPPTMPTRTEADGIHILHWGRLEQGKGVDVLLLAFDLVRRHEPKARLTIVGTGSLEHALRAAAPTGVVFIGHKSPSDIRRLCGGATMAVFPSTRESFSLGLIESLAQELPVVASRTGAAPEVLDHSRCGLIVRPDDVTEMAAAILNIHAELKKFKLRCHETRPWILERFSWDKFVFDFLDSDRQGSVMV
jgi:glycosyltransferase involved in cell wall biosynthesis